MEIFLVGGAVRDFLLAEMSGQFKRAEDKIRYWAEVEKDWVVVGSSPEEMLKQGFRPVGKSFPVFLHPQTSEEYALARTERKTGRGYTGFECDAGEHVTLEEDLKRRDLTINAIAARVSPSYDLKIIDPYQGQQDLAHKVFRHVSPAFAEDPVRILRLARLAARFHDFDAAPETVRLMQQMVSEGEVDALVPERVWQEWSRSLRENAPWRFLEVLKQCYAFDRLFPELNYSNDKKQILQMAVHHQESAIIILALELVDLEENSLQSLIKKYRIPNEFSDLTLLVAMYHSLFLSELLTPEQILALFEKTDAFRRPQRFKQFASACSYIPGAIDTKIRKDCLIGILNIVQKIDNAKLLAQGMKGKEIALALRERRLEVIRNTKLP